MDKKDKGLILGIVGIAAGSFITGFGIGEYLERRDNDTRWRMFRMFLESKIEALEKKTGEQKDES